MQNNNLPKIKYELVVKEEKQQQEQEPIPPPPPTASSATSWFFNLFGSVIVDKPDIKIESNQEPIPLSTPLSQQQEEPQHRDHERVIKLVKEGEARNKRRRQNIRTRNGLDEGFMYCEDPEEFNELMDRFIEHHDLTAKRIIKDKFGLDLDKLMYAPYH